jgi:CarD family transcriptional regulator
MGGTASAIFAICLCDNRINDALYSLFSTPPNTLERYFMSAKALPFDVGDYVVYPKHGVGRVIELQNQEIAGMQLELYVLRFEKERMTLRVPTNKIESIGMRKLSSDKTLREALDVLKSKPKVKRTMWSRRAQEYEAKINSGELVSIAEVTRDLFRADDQPEQSYSERQIFEAASSRLARELAAMEKTDEPTALTKILEILNEHAPLYYETAEES